MELKKLSHTNLQYNLAGLAEAYHVSYYIPNGDITDWTNRIKIFKWGNNQENDKFIIDSCVEAVKGAELKFDYVIRTLGSSETRALTGSRLRPLALKIADITNATYLPQLLKKKRATTPLHTLPDLPSRIREMSGVFEINEEADLNNKKILIVDDISTACVTSAEMVKTLKKKWPKAVFYLFCIARTDYNVNANEKL